MPVPPPERPSTGACMNLDPGPSPLRLLTRTEYGNTVRDLFGNPPNVLGDLPEDGRPARGYANDAYARSASDAMVAGFMKAAEKLAAAAVADVPKLAGCDPAGRRAGLSEQVPRQLRPARLAPAAQPGGTAERDHGVQRGQGQRQRPRASPRGWRRR